MRPCGRALRRSVHARNSDIVPMGLNSELFIELQTKLMHRRKKPVRLILDSLPRTSSAPAGLDVRGRETARTLILPSPICSLYLRLLSNG
jgi:hypothetical protein